MNSIATHRSIALVHSLSATHARHVATLVRGVLVHVLVAGLQLFAPHALSSAGVHCTQSPPAPHTGVPERCVQSALVVHVVHACVLVSQRAAAAVVHCVLSRHATHARAVVSQCVLLAVQSASATQPTHV